MHCLHCCHTCLLPATTTPGGQEGRQAMVMVSVSWWEWGIRRVGGTSSLPPPELCCTSCPSGSLPDFSLFYLDFSSTLSLFAGLCYTHFHTGGLYTHAPFLPHHPFLPPLPLPDRLFVPPAARARLRHFAATLRAWQKRFYLLQHGFACARTACLPCACLLCHCLHGSSIPCHYLPRDERLRLIHACLTQILSLLFSFPSFACFHMLRCLHVFCFGSATAGSDHSGKCE